MTAALRESSSLASREQQPQRAEQQPEVHVTWAGWCFLLAATATTTPSRTRLGRRRSTRRGAIMWLSKLVRRWISPATCDQRSRRLRRSLAQHETIRAKPSVTVERMARTLRSRCHHAARRSARGNRSSARPNGAAGRACTRCDRSFAGSEERRERRGGGLGDAWATRHEARRGATRSRVRETD